MPLEQLEQLSPSPTFSKVINCYFDWETEFGRFTRVGGKLQQALILAKAPIDSWIASANEDYKPAKLEEFLQAHPKMGSLLGDLETIRNTAYLERKATRFTSKAFDQ